MSDNTTYTMYRKDARGTIEVDLNDPDWSLKQLIEKQKDIVEDLAEKYRFHEATAVSYSNQLESAEEALTRLEHAQDVVRKAIGPGEREREGAE